jgi:hypothetical protein
MPSRSGKGIVTSRPARNLSARLPTELRRLAVLVASAALLTVFVAVSAAATGTATQSVRKTSGPVLALAADGDRAAFIVEGRLKECWSVMVWKPARRQIDQLESAAKCESTDRLNRRGPPTVALAGSRAVWLQLTGGNSLETILRTATLARPTPAWIAVGNAYYGEVGTFVRPPGGDGTLLAFTIERICGTDDPPYCPPGRMGGDVVEATVWRIGGTGRCPNAVTRSPVRCSVVAKADSELTVLAVDAGRIAVRTASGVRLLTQSGRVLRDIAVTGARKAALSGRRVAVKTASAVEVYDSATGQLSARFPFVGGRLEDLDGDILVTASGGTVTLRRLSNGRTTTIHAGRTGLAQLEQPGLFVASARRVTFIPMRDVLRRLGG